MKRKHWCKVCLIISLMVLAAFVMAGCSGSDGKSAPTAGTITGTVLTSTGTPIANATVSAYSNNKLSKKVTDSAERYKLARAIVAGETPVATATTGSDGKYTLSSVPPGAYTITFSHPNYTIGSIEMSMIAGASPIVNAGMGSSIAVAASTAGAPTVALTASDDEVGFGNTVTLKATASSPVSGVTLTYTWTGAVVSGTDPLSATVTMASLATA
ncbi:MAG: carboxypeptidase-like regulatory domain-containing protein, partial [Syntrophales bacterium LBB04]|nr:carboxypeptidase-like regulatory domain-containing protein [Syntrophales bacterium LBB04]